jgi:hypothetical protein
MQFWQLWLVRVRQHLWGVMPVCSRFIQETYQRQFWRGSAWIQSLWFSGLCPCGRRGLMSYLCNKECSVTMVAFWDKKFSMLERGGLDVDAKWRVWCEAYVVAHRESTMSFYAKLLGWSILQIFFASSHLFVTYFLTKKYFHQNQTYILANPRCQLSMLVWPH